MEDLITLKKQVKLLETTAIELRQRLNRVVKSLEDKTIIYGVGEIQAQQAIYETIRDLNKAISSAEEIQGIKMKDEINIWLK